MMTFILCILILKQRKHANTLKASIKVRNILVALAVIDRITNFNKRDSKVKNLAC